MLPQPNFGPTSSPGDDESEGPPRQVGRLRIALWVQTAFAVLAGNYLVVSLFVARQATLDQLIEIYAEVDSPRETAEQALEYYRSTEFLVGNLAFAGIMVIAAIVSALCAMRLKTRLKSVRRLAITASIVLLIFAMLTTLQLPGFFMVLMLWVFASIMAVWWLFAGDVKHWMTAAVPAAAEEPPSEEEA